MPRDGGRAAPPTTTEHPSHSIVNTQLKLINPAWAEEVRVIEDELPEYLYAFPPKEAASLHDVLYAGTDLFEET